jgi:hypothetical protein
VHRLAEAEHERLRGAVGRGTGEGLERRRRGDVDHGPATPLRHLRQIDRLQVEEGQAVHGDHPDEPLALRSGEVLAAAEPRVVHEDLNVDAELADPPDQIIARHPIAEIGTQRLRTNAELVGELARERAKACLAPRDQRHAVTAPRELARDRLTDSRRSAGDESGRRVAGLGQRHVPRLSAEGAETPRSLTHQQRHPPRFRGLTPPH